MDRHRCEWTYTKKSVVETKLLSGKSGKGRSKVANRGVSRRRHVLGSLRGGLAQHHLCTFDDGEVLEGVDLGLPLVDALALDDRELFHDERLAQVHLLDHVVDHAAALGNQAALAGVPGALDGVGALEAAGERRVQVDDGDVLLLERGEAGAGEDEHPAGTHHEVGALLDDEARQVGVEAVPGLLPAGGLVLADSLVVRFQRMDQAGNAGLGCPLQPVRLGGGRDHLDNVPLQRPVFARGGIDQRL